MLTPVETSSDITILPLLIVIAIIAAVYFLVIKKKYPNESGKFEQGVKDKIHDIKEDITNRIDEAKKVDSNEKVDIKEEVKVNTREEVKVNTREEVKVEMREEPKVTVVKAEEIGVIMKPNPIPPVSVSTVLIETPTVTPTVTPIVTPVITPTVVMDLPKTFNNIGELLAVAKAVNFIYAIMVDTQLVYSGFGPANQYYTQTNGTIGSEKVQLEGKLEIKPEVKSEVKVNVEEEVIAGSSDEIEIEINSGVSEEVILEDVKEDVVKESGVSVDDTRKAEQQARWWDKPNS